MKTWKDFLDTQHINLCSKVEKKRPVPVLTDRPNKKFAQENKAMLSHREKNP